MLRLFWKAWWKIFRWKFSGIYPYTQQKMLLIVAPHTSWKDILVGMAARSKLNTRIHFLGKKELFDGPFGWLFRWQGGIPVDRFSAHGVVDQVVDLFNSSESFALAMAPEGTRKKVYRLRTGFYHIALKAKVPLLMVGFDFSKREVIFSEPFMPTGNEEADFKKILAFFGPIKGKHPEKGLGHLAPSIPNAFGTPARGGSNTQP